MIEEEIKATSKESENELSQNFVDEMLAQPFEDWHGESRDTVARTTAEPGKKFCFNLYLQSKPARLEQRVIKEFLLGQKLTDPRAVRNVMTSISMVSMNESIMSRDT